jgi:hypothetical protein
MRVRIAAAVNEGWPARRKKPAQTLCAALTKYGGYSGAEREALAAVVAAGLKSTPLTTAVGFLPGLQEL